MSDKFYAGIGSRETPHDVCQLMTRVATKLAAEGWTLRSGHAQGADRAFEVGAQGEAQIYLPWPSFGVKRYKDDPGMPVLGEALCLSDLAMLEAHKLLQRLGIRSPHDGYWQLHARNVYQIQGHLKSHPLSKFVVCWCPVINGQPVGGTATAVKLAEHHKIPVFNLFVPAHRARVEAKL